MLRAPRQNCTFFGIAHFKHPHPRYGETLLLAHLVQRYASLGRHAKRAHFLGILRFKHTYTRYPKTLLPTSLVQRYGCLGCHVKPRIFLPTAPHTHSKPAGLIYSQNPVGLKNCFQSLVCHLCTAVSLGCKIP